LVNLASITKDGGTYRQRHRVTIASARQPHEERRDRASISFAVIHRLPLATAR
jgi:hypothetical protein